MDKADNVAGDPIAQVCGVPAAAILARAAAGGARLDRAMPPSLLPDLTVPPPPAGSPIDDEPPAPPQPRRAGWSLLDLGDGSREQFIEAAHQAILGRSAGPAEVALRLAQLARGRTRFGIVLRLALSEEGRRIAAPPVHGPGLRAIHKLAPRLVTLARLPVLRAAQRALRTRRRG